MEFNYDDEVKNYQARYYKNLGYSDEDILSILGDPTNADTGGGVTPQLVDQLGRGGDDNNPYSKTAIMPGVRSQANYNRDPYQSMMYEEAFGKNLGDPEFNRATGALNADGLLSYAGDKPPTKFEQMISGAANFIPGIGMAKRGIEYLADKLPINRRGILENELLGAGVMLDDIGRVVSNDYNSAEGIMAGYNANQIDADTFDKRRDTIANTLATKYGMSPAEIEAAIAGEYEGDVETDLIDRLGYLNTAQTNIFNPKNIVANQMVQQKEAARAEAAEIQRQKDIQDAINKEKSKPGAATFNPNTTSGGAGNYRSDRDHSGSGGYGGSDKRSADNRSSDLGFSDIRLKENVELIGKSPSNINIYKFNYKDNPTTYQGAMAHEVPWASVKHSNGYMMVDYSKLDVQFKKL
jgi:hypothetical protein